MKIKATKPIIDWDGEAGQMVVLNAGDTGTLSETMRVKHEGSWEPSGKRDLPQLDRDNDGEAGGSLPHEPPALAGKNKAELTAIAEAEGVDISAARTNAEIVVAIEAAREAAASDAESGDSDGEAGGSGDDGDDEGAPPA